MPGGEGGAGGVEREVKLTAWPGFALPDLDDVVPGARTRRRSTVDLEATYLDTADLRLGRSGLTLRHRRRGPRETWTLKLPADDALPDGISRREVDVPGPIDEVPELLRLLVAAHARRRLLVRVARLTTVRRRTAVEAPGGGLLAEVDDDEVSVMDGGRVAARFRELEVELAPGAPSEVADAVVARLCRAGAEVDEPQPKLARALGPRFVEPPDVVVEDLPAEPSAGDVVARAIRASVRRILDHHAAAVLGEDPEGVHQVRVGARRLRSDLKTFRPLLDRATTDPIRSELRELGRLLGDVRDPDVLDARLRDGAGRALTPGDAVAVDAVLARLADDRERARGRMLRALASDRYLQLLDDLVALAQHPPLTTAASARAADVLPGLVRTQWTRLRRMVRHLPPVPADEELHEVRKAAKQVRYAAEAVAPAVGKPARRAARGAEAVQGILGQHQDAVHAEAWLRDVAGRSETDLATAFACGALVADERHVQADLRAAWTDAWADASAPRRWRWVR